MKLGKQLLNSERVFVKYFHEDLNLFEPSDLQVKPSPSLFVLFVRAPPLLNGCF